jgi:hypothetical protein
MSAGRESGRSGWWSGDVVSLDVVAEEDGKPSITSALDSVVVGVVVVWTDRERMVLVREERPAVAFSLATGRFLLALE